MQIKIHLRARDTVDTHNPVQYGTNFNRAKLTRTRLPSNLRPTTRECMHLVTRGYFRSRDKDGGHTIRSAVAENPVLYVHFKALCFVERE